MNMEGGSKRRYGVKMTENKDDAPWLLEWRPHLLQRPDWLDDLLPLHVGMPEGYDPASVFNLPEDETFSANEACHMVSHGIWTNAKIAGRRNRGKKSGRKALEELKKTSKGAAASFLPSLRKLLAIHPRLKQVGQQKESWIISVGDDGLTDAEIAVLEGLVHVGLPIDTLHKLGVLHRLLSEKVSNADAEERYLEFESNFPWHDPHDPYGDPAWKHHWVRDEAMAELGDEFLASKRARSYREFRERWILSMAMVWEICTGSWPSYAREPAAAGPKPLAFMEFCLSAAQVEDPDHFGDHPTRGVIFFTEGSGLTHIRETMRRYNKARSTWEAAQ